MSCNNWVLSFTDLERSQEHAEDRKLKQDGKETVAELASEIEVDDNGKLEIDKLYNLPSWKYTLLKWSY